MISGGYQSAGLRRRQFARKLKWYIITSSVFILLIAVFYIIGYSGLFSIKSFTVVGAPDGQETRILVVLRPQVIATQIGGLLGMENYFSWDNSLVYSDIRSNSVSVDKKLWGREVTITVHPRQRYGIWCTEPPDNLPVCNWVDPEGVVFEPAPIPDGQLIIRISDPSTSSPMLLGEPVIARSQFQVIQKVAEALPELRLPVARILVNRELEEVRLITLSGALIRFSLRFDPSKTALPALKRFIESPGLSAVSSVDFTVENRAFYKAK